MRSIQFAALLTATVACTLALAAAPPVAVPAYVAAAVADASRPATDTQRDVNRKPDMVLTFSGVKPGDKVGELIPGRGYFSRLFCKVVGDQGHVYAVGITPVKRPGTAPAPADIPAGAKPAAPAAPAAPAPPPPPPVTGTPCTNITASATPPTEFALPGGLDIVWTSENYHDLAGPYFAVDIKAFNKIVYDALKPGGLYLVEDHAAAAGSGTNDSGTLHRIDKVAVIAEVTAAGFRLEAESNVLANADDPHTEPVFKMGGKSDKFLLKFRKPSR